MSEYSDNDKSLEDFLKGKSNILLNDSIFIEKFMKISLRKTLKNNTRLPGIYFFKFSKQTG